jgi:hypothetical protein
MCLSTLPHHLAFPLHFTLIFPTLHVTNSFHYFHCFYYVHNFHYVHVHIYTLIMTTLLLTFTRPVCPLYFRFQRIGVVRVGKSTLLPLFTAFLFDAGMGRFQINVVVGVTKKQPLLCLTNVCGGTINVDGTATSLPRYPFCRRPFANAPSWFRGWAALQMAVLVYKQWQ